MIQMEDYKVYRDMGLCDKTNILIGFKKIQVHLVFAVKHDERHKSRLVADGHLTNIPPAESIYAVVVLLIRGLRICILISELSNMDAYATDIGNSYLETKTQEKVCIKAGPEFEELEGHLLIVNKTLYGLRSSGKHFGDRIILDVRSYLLLSLLLLSYLCSHYNSFVLHCYPESEPNALTPITCS